jgi:hypothetical protein
MTLLGVDVALGTWVGGTIVGVSVGGMAVDVGNGVCVGGRLVGTSVAGSGVVATVQPASARISKLDNNIKGLILIIFSPFNSLKIIIIRCSYPPG